MGNVPRSIISFSYFERELPLQTTITGLMPENLILPNDKTLKTPFTKLSKQYISRLKAVVMRKSHNYWRFGYRLAGGLDGVQDVYILLLEEFNEFSITMEIIPLNFQTKQNPLIN